MLALALGGALEASVDTAADGAEAQALLERRGGGFDLLLTDERMPGLHGSDLIRWVRRHRLVPQCVLMSAYHDGPALAEAAGADLFLRKPFELREALPQLRRRLHGAGSGA